MYFSLEVVYVKFLPYLSFFTLKKKGVRDRLTIKLLIILWLIYPVVTLITLYWYVN